MTHTTSAVQNSDVVLNNKTTETTQTITVSTTSSTSDIVTTHSIRNLINARKSWEDGAYKKSNEILYGILRDCYAMDFNMRKSMFDKEHNERAVKSKAALELVAKELGYNFKSSTPTINRIVQCVFGNVARSRVSSYSKVLRSARQHDVKVLDLISFIENGGGIEQIRLKASDNYKSPSQKAEIAKPNVVANSLAVVKSDELGKLINADSIDEQCVLIATQNADGSFAINAVVRSKSALTAALVAYYGQKSADLKQNIDKQQAANDSDIRADIAKNIVNK